MDLGCRFFSDGLMWRAMKKEWLLQTPDPEAVRALQAAIGCSPVTAAVLVNRNIKIGRASCRERV